MGAINLYDTNNYLADYDKYMKAKEFKKISNNELDDDVIAIGDMEKSDD